MPPKRIIIDTDPGVDDALTFLLALSFSTLYNTALVNNLPVSDA